jgi:hypothetical protein
MAAIETCLDVCKSIQYTLEDISGGLYSMMHFPNESNGMSKLTNDFLKTPLTERFRSRVEKPNDINCSSVSTTVTYDLPMCNETSLECADVTFGCVDSPTDHQPCGTATPTISDCVADGFSISSDDWCLENHIMSVEASKAMIRMAKKMYRTRNQKLIDKLVLMPGAYFGETTSSLLAPRPLKLFTPDVNGRAIPQPEGIIEVSKEYMKQTGNYTDGDHVIITGSNYFKVAQMTSDLYAGNNEGLDRTRMSGVGSVYYDQTLATTLDKNCAISFLPGSIHYLEYFMFQGQREITDGRVTYLPLPAFNNPNIRRQVINLAPFLGLVGEDFFADVEIHVDVCNSTAPRISVRAKHMFDLWCPPQDAYCGDFNFKLKWELACAPYTCTDINC